jgi:hypothetical protein
MKRMLLCLPLAFVLAGLAGACGVKDKIETKIDCHSICQRYSDCFDKSYDVSACESRCENKVDQKTLTVNDVDECSDCIDGNSCTGGAISCATECASILL